MNRQKIYEFAMLLAAAILLIGTTVYADDPLNSDQESEEQSAEGTGEPTARTPEQLFRSILTLSRNKRYEDIRALVVPIPSDERMSNAGYRDSRDLAIEMIRNQAYPKNGDFAYSNAALEDLIEHHLDKFSTMPAKYHERLRQEDPYASASDVQEALENDPNGFLQMAYSGVNIIIVRVRGDYRLLFWEHLPRLAGGQQ